MMINTFNISKGLIISIVYNVIILTFVNCDGSDTEDNKIPPVPDYEPGGVYDKNYFEYHFRSTYPGQFKLNPNSYFASKYNCAYIVLPELKYNISNLVNDVDNYVVYKEIMSCLLKNYQKHLNKLKVKYLSIKFEESNLAHAVQKTYNATKNAYLAVANFEDNVNENKEELKNTKDFAIQDYLKNQMSIPTLRSTISVNYDQFNIFYTINNFELYIDPTEEIFYRSRVIKEEISALNEAIDLLKNNSCRVLNKEEYNEVIFLYLLLPSKDYNCQTYEKMKILFALKLQESFGNSNLTNKYDNFSTSEDKNNSKSYNLCNKMKSKYVVNNENFLSYLIRLKRQGYIGIHQDKHKFLYDVRIENYVPPNINKWNMIYTIDMDLLEENFERKKLQPIKNFERKTLQQLLKQHD